MKILFILTAAVFLPFSFLLTGCAGYASSTKDIITVQDSLSLKGSCILTGTILDDNSNQPIRGANVVLLSKPIRTVTDLYGQFQVIDILPGKYTLQVFCVGYIQRDFPDIQTRPDRLIKFDIRLKPRPVRTE